MDPYDYPEALEAIRKLKATIGDTFTFTELLQMLSIWRDHPLEYVEISLQPGQYGCIIPASDKDLLCVAKDLSGPMKLYIGSHEAGHVLGGHVPRGCDVPDAPTSEQFLYVPHIRQKYLESCLSFSNNISQDIYKEHVAESIGFFLLECYKDGNIPQTAMKLYGWKGKNR